MAAGPGAAGGSLESKLDKRFQAVSNTMDSIQGLSAWCIDNKKFHSQIVRYWMKWLRKSDAAHRLNLVYLANDIIQNCKRKNAIVYRTAFAEMLPDAFLMVNNDGNAKVLRSVERILSIWEERKIYTGELISELRGYLKEEVKEESPPDTPAESKTPSDSKAALKSKIVAEFVPATLVEQLSTYKSSLEEVELREKQLAAMRVDVCSSAALRKLKDKAGGKRFSRDFEEGSAKLQDFVKFLERESKGGLLEALANADIFYEMQYQEVKIVANAYQTFANRVSHLKRKLDALKTTLPDLDDSPIPSPSADAPSPTGSESPFRGMMDHSDLDPDLDGSAMDDDADRPAPSPLSSPGGSPPPAFGAMGENDNRDVEDMDLSEEETEAGGGIIVEEQVKCPSPAVNVAQPVAATTNKLPSSRKTTEAPPIAPPASGVAPRPASTDLSKIGALLNSLTATSKAAGPAVESPPSPPATTPPASLALPAGGSLGSLLSQVDLTPEGLLSALSKVQGSGSGLHGLTSMLNRPAQNVPTDSRQSKAQTSPPPPSTLTTTITAVAAAAASSPPTGNPLPSLPPTPSPSGFAVKQSPTARTEAPDPVTVPAPVAASAPATSRAASALVQALHRDMDLATEPEPVEAASDSLESKIHSFLQGNPGFSAFNLSFGADSTATAGSRNLSPVAGTDTRDGTPVRDEGGGTPTQDEVMDNNQAARKFAAEAPPLLPLPPPLPSPKMSAQPAGDILTPGTYQNNTWGAPRDPLMQPHLQQQQQPGDSHNGQGYQPYPSAGQEMTNPGVAAPPAHYQAFTAEQGSRLPPIEAAQGSTGGSQPVEGCRDDGHRGWYGSTYPEVGAGLNHRGHVVVAPGGGEESQPPGRYRYQQDPNLEPHGTASQQAPRPSEFYNSNLPPVPRLPPPPVGFDATPPANVGKQQMIEGVPGPKVDSIISGMVVHDHQHKSVFHLDEPPYDRRDDRYHRPEDPPHPDDLGYQDELGHYREDPYRPGAPPHKDEGPPFRPPHDPYFRPNEPYYQEASPPHGYPRGPLSPSEGFHYDFQSHDLPPRRPLPPPHPEMCHPGPRPPLRPMLHPARHPHPRGPRHPGPPFPAPFRGPDPWLRGKRPGPRGGGPRGPGFPPKRPFLPPCY